MKDAVIVSTARTPIGKAYRGFLNDTHGSDIGAHAVLHAVQRAGIDPSEIEAFLAADRAARPWVYPERLP